jgi:FAD/FMN-containing dehydrogenase
MVCGLDFFVGKITANMCAAAGGGDLNTIVVDLKNMQAVSWDDAEIARVGAGITLGDLDTFLNSKNRSMAHGTCPQVGIGGHATIGGLGPASRMWGPALDHIVGATVVLANSSVVTVSGTQNSDLFWALKGAGASFGVITEFLIQTHPSPGEVVQYTYTFSGISPSDSAARFKAWQTLVSDPNLSQKFASQAVMTEIGMIITGTYFGSQAEFNSLNMTSVFPQTTSASVVVFNNWLGLASHWAEDAALEIGGGIPNAFYAKNLAVTPDSLLPPAAIDDIFTYIATAQKGTLLWFIIFDLAGGVTNQLAADATAYAHRDALYFMQAYVANPLGTLPASSVDFLTTLVAKMEAAVPALAANGAYPGYVDPALGEAGQVAYWRENYPRLQQVKRAWDPADVFRNPQSVRLPA